MAQTSKYYTDILIFLILFVSLISCTSETVNIKGEVFRYNEHRNVTSLDPAFARNPQNIWPVNQIFNGLVQLDDSLKVVPEIAKSWNISANGLEYNFTLRNDVFFHYSKYFGKNKTRKVVSSDFVYSLNRLKDSLIGSPGSWVLQNIKSYKSINDSLLRFNLKKPFPGFLGLLTMKYCSVVPREAVSLSGENFGRNPVGTGPFCFKKWNENTKLVLRKNINYFELDDSKNKLPYLESIAISFISDIQSEFMLFSQGKLDMLNSLDSSFKDELLTLEGNLRSKYLNKLNIQKGPYLNTEYIGFFLGSESQEVNSRKIREAINIGFNRHVMISYLRNNIGYPAKKGIIPKGLIGTSDIDFEFNRLKAQKLVNEFIEESKIKNPTITISTDSNYLDLCEFLQRELEKIGLTIKINVLPPSILRDAKSNGKLEMFIASWIADYPDAENYLSLFYSNNFSPKGPNYTHYKNIFFDSLYKKSFSFEKKDKRLKLYKMMDSAMISNYPIVPLYYDQVIRFTQKNIEGLSLNPINLLNLKKVRKIQKK